MFQQRANPIFQENRNMVQAWDRGVIRRITWMVTSWVRTIWFYRSGFLLAQPGEGILWIWQISRQ